MTSPSRDPKERAAAFVDAARDLAGLRWVPLDLNGKEPRKRQWQKATYAPPELVAGQWAEWGKRWNMGVLLGASGLEVLEYDSDAARDRLLDLLGGEWPHVPTVESGRRSRHLYFQAAGHNASARDGLELRAGGQQCVVPPSVHPETGRDYRWLVTPWEAQLVPVPETVLAYFASANGKPAGQAEPVGEEIRENDPGRHRTLLSLAGSMRHRGMGSDEIAAALLAVNAKRCKPPLPEEEVAELARDVARRYKPAPPDPEQEALRRQAEQLLEDEVPVEPVSVAAGRRQAGPLIVSLVEFLGGSEDDAAWLVDHLAARGALVLVAGLPKVGKSTFVYGLLGALTSAADRFVGLPTGSTSALLMTEEPPATVEEKVDRFGVDDERVFVISKRKMGAGRTWPKTVAAAVAFCRARPEVGIVVVDTWDKFVGLSSAKSETDTGTIVEMIEPLYELLGLGVCVILITHQRKQEGEHGVRVRGGTALTGSVDVIVEVERATQAAGLPSSARVVKIVSRFADAPDEIAVELNEHGWRSLGTVKAAARRSKRGEVLVLLGDEPATLEEIHENAGGGPSKDTIRRRLGELVKDSLADRVGDGKRSDPFRWLLSENGRIFQENALQRNGGDPADRAESSFASSPPPKGEAACKETAAGDPG